MSRDITQLKTAFENQSAKVGVIGLGYVGLPLILTFVGKTFQTIGFDIDEAKVNALINGESYINHISSQDITRAIANEQFSPTNDFSKISDVDAILICVPTPLGETQEPDLSYIVSTGELIAPHLKAGQLIVLESTTYPGTTADLIRPILERGGLKSGADFFLA